MKIENKIDFYNIPKIVKCEICNKQLNYINASHLKKHNLSTKQYRRLYPSAHMQSSQMLLKHSKTLKELFIKYPEKWENLKNFSKEQFDKIRNDDKIIAKRKLHHDLYVRRGHHLSEEHKKILSKVNKGKRLSIITKKKLSDSISKVKREDIIIIIKELKEEGYTQEMIADQLGITQALISLRVNEFGIKWDKPSMKGNLNPNYKLKIGEEKYGSG